MVTTRLQERLGLDTPNSSSVEDTSNRTVSPTISRASKRQAASKNEIPKNSANSEASKISVEADQTPQPRHSRIDTPVTTNQHKLPQRLKSPVEFYTPRQAKTPANKRKRFDSNEPEDSILDTFQTPAEYPQTRNVATEEQDDDDDGGGDDSDAAPEVVSTRSSARRSSRNPRGSATKGSTSKRRKTATLPTTEDKEPNLASTSDTIDVISPKPTSVGTDVVRDQSTTEEATDADFTGATATAINDQDEPEPVANPADNPSLTDSDTTITAHPTATDQASESLSKVEESSAATKIEDASTIVVEPTTGNHDDDDDDQEEPTESNVPPVPSSPTRRDQDKPVASHVQSETLSPSPSASLRVPVPAVTNPTTTTTTTASAAKQSTPISRIQSTAHTDSAHTRPSGIVKKARSAKSTSSTPYTQRQPASAALPHHEHLLKAKPTPTTSLQHFRSRMLNRHVRTTDFGGPGPKKVKFVGA